ncbi:HAMP domain-containing sensor histidine kinase [uncultured Acetatifactor sp.]|uniref:HAMP domain-containing sensor histidine kinase n=1 Tax=uncultured Acetatifactor sp. TaxID=1671927 RepID=UPI0026091A15|nr:HAMP domain-containing sensor histidine kinase [uncultured Acetatifactor sp.]
MTLLRMIPNYILINGIVIAGTVFVIFLVYRRLSSTYQKRLTVYFLKAACVSLAVSLVVLAVVLSMMQLLLHSGLWDYFHDLGYKYLIAAEYLPSVVAVALTVICFIVSFSVRINRRVRYVEYLSQEIQKIREEGFGRTMELQGDDEITRLCAVINEMSVQLREKEEREKRQQRSKDELITNVSHDLRSPLTSIIGYVELLKETGPEDRQRFAEYIEVVERRLTGLNGLINELFEYTKLNSADQLPDMEKRDVLELLRHILYEYKVLMEAEGLTLSWQLEAESHMAHINTRQMVRVFQNLLDNARRYAHRADPVTVTAQDTGRLHICITNRVADPHGIEPDRIFERFYCGDRARSAPQSSGLGLAIVKRIVELHGGQVDASLQGQELSIHLFLK